MNKQTFFEIKKEGKTGQITFKAIVLATGGNTTRIVVPNQVVATLGPHKRPAVNVSFSGTHIKAK